MQTITLASPAKVNLFLEVTGRRPNGYHELATVFAKTEFGDTMTLEKTPAGITFELDNQSGCELKADENNLAVRAAKIFFEIFGVTGGVHIKLQKRIPIGAGLGGGSSNAAAALRGLCRLYTTGHAPEKNAALLSAAAKLGADVPVFIYPQPLCRAEGIGDIITPLDCPGPLPYIVIVYPQLPVPTPWVYKNLVLPDEKEVLTNLSSLRTLIGSLERGAPVSTWGTFLFNRLEKVVLPTIGPVSCLHEELRSAGDVAVLMSGSGSCVFALCGDKAVAELAARRVSGAGRQVIATRLLGGYQYADNGNPHTSDERGAP